MPGNGEIGGGSCTVKFKTYANDPTQPDSTVETCDRRGGKSVTVYIKLPGSTKWDGPYTVDDKQKIEFSWPNHP